jgi:hypothetical protein
MTAVLIIEICVVDLFRMEFFFIFFYIKLRGSVFELGSFYNNKLLTLA